MQKLKSSKKLALGPFSQKRSRMFFRSEIKVTCKIHLFYIVLDNVCTIALLETCEISYSQLCIRLFEADIITAIQGDRGGGIHNNCCGIAIIPHQVI